MLGDADLIPDADTAGILREGLRALDRIEAKAAQVHAGGGGGGVRHEPAAAGTDAIPAETLSDIENAISATSIRAVDLA